jgi:4-alpha-glucanotransferase
MRTGGRTGLARLAEVHGIAPTYRDWRRRERLSSDRALVAILAALGVDAQDPAAAAAALAAAEEAPWRRVCPPTVLLIGQAADEQVMLHVAEDADVVVGIQLEDGTPGPTPAPPGQASAERVVDGTTVQARPLALPAGLPLGYHDLHVTVDGATTRSTLVVAPRTAGVLPPADGQHWGWMVQLYAMRSAASWGIGDLADLRELAVHSAAALGAAFVVCNPLHAATPVAPLEPSPYFPSSRRFTNPLYLRIEELPELAAAPADVRDRVAALAQQARAANTTDRIDRDEVWGFKRAALEQLHAVPAPPARAHGFTAFRAAHGRALEDFALFCALAEHHTEERGQGSASRAGAATWRSWPAEVRRPDGPGIDAARVRLAERIDFHAWLQFCCDAQLADAQAAATRAGMPIGLIHDLAVGVDPGGADGWALQDDLALGVTIGAPPDDFNQRGQDWALPPLRPDRLASTGYLPFRQIIGSVLRHAGGIRIDHVMGLFRLWWVPQDLSPADGAYVSYPARDLLAVLALEAHRAGAVVVGEDLGTVEPEVRRALRDADVVGSRVAYFERTAPDDPDPDRRLRPAEYDRDVLATVTTHDLPTAAGWWTDEDARVQAALGLLGEGVTLDGQLARKAAERADMESLLRAEGLLGGDPSLEDRVLALHALLGRTPCRMVAAAPGDAVGDLRQPNMPGTIHEYPNWRLPLAVPAGDTHRPLLREAWQAHPGVPRLVHAMRGTKDPSA